MLYWQMNWDWWECRLRTGWQNPFHHVAKSGCRVSPQAKAQPRPMRQPMLPHSKPPQPLARRNGMSGTCTERVVAIHRAYWACLAVSVQYYLCGRQFDLVALPVPGVGVRAVKSILSSSPNLQLNGVATEWPMTCTQRVTILIAMAKDGNWE
ncbi:uncharacterized protein LOC144115645 [Amblyomma americanum]